ncbi:AbrB/MazE/SpoVT family DNA-binding domain-containing protein [Candidatus Woesearchaeota archaeon]|jgi:bifunctional DNA-binding transcriptional regulator/antitoxin component of YhaV-PrlF toxin-antitoxin module|nr:AbrB/MazE/SpoVT family DNA-binding domain-containing protein [Candidatus Woesearchaeota archaeon]MBT5215650.1 AbrB/MazE/SpoVT family DNA-binding domain-containing protein [Candidatus Woesearchaeota archaeon]MBT6402473.1 AbrB/MazE/SpoVT family DNA-binding domain-containing protein [Candidatus Woesearchaeota archaeon]
MEITKLSTKGQIVIPEKLRSDLEVGEAFVVIKKENLLVLRKIEGLSKTEIQELEELQKIWNEIDKGNCKTSTQDGFIKEMESW